MDPDTAYKVLDGLYYDTSNSTAYTSGPKLWEYIKVNKLDISKKQFNDWKSKQTTFTTHTQAKQKFKRVRVIARGIDSLWDADLLQISAFSAQNDGINFILVAIDVFSRYLRVKKMKSKSAQDSLAAIKQLFEEVNQLPVTFRSDMGGEFANRLVKKFIKDSGVYQQLTYNKAKANYAEILIKNLKGRIYKYMARHQTHRYIDELDNFVRAYNNTIHKALNGRTPAEISPDIEAKVWVEQYLPPPRKPKKIAVPKYKIGDLVRISFVKTVFSRGYHQSFSEELFRVVRIHKTNPITYSLQDLQKSALRGLFYESELVYVGGDLGDMTFKIEKILRRRTVRGQRQVLIKWLGYSDKFNSWETEDSISLYSDTL